MDKLLKQAQGLLADIEALHGKRADEQDAEKVKAIDAELAAKDADYKAVKARIDVARDMAARRRDLTPADDGGASGAAPGTVADRAPAEAKDANKDEEMHVRAFIKAMTDNSLSDAERNVLKPRSSILSKSKDASGGFRMPRAMALRMFPEMFRFGDANEAIEQYVARVTRPQMHSRVMLSTDTTDGGGLLFGQDFRPTLLELPPEPTHILPMATVVPSPTGTITWPKLVQTDANEFGSVSVEWIEEGGTKPETEPTFEQVQIQAHELAAYTEISIRLLARSAIGLEALLTRLFREAMLDAIDDRFLNGSGTGEPNGVVNETGIRTVARTAANQVAYTDLVHLKHALRPYHRSGATFVCGDDVEEFLELTVDSQNRPLFRATVQDGGPVRLIGYPYTVTTRVPAIGSEGDIIFGDWREYIVAMEQEVVVRRSEHYKFRNNVIAFVVYAVVGGRAVQPRVFAILEGES